MTLTKVLLHAVFLDTLAEFIPLVKISKSQTKKNKVLQFFFCNTNTSVFVNSCKSLSLIQ